MRSATAKSWELRFDVPEQPHIALFVRDALRLDETAGRQPPRLEDQVVDLRSSLTDDERLRLAAAFLPRCREAELLEGWTAGPHGDSDEERLAFHRQLERGTAEFHEPLTGHPELRHLAAAWFAEHRERHQPLHPDPQLAREHWEVCRDAVQAAATELDVEPGQLSASTWLLMVHGLWWATPKPGQLLYSPAVRADRPLLTGLLQDTFSSSLQR